MGNVGLGGGMSKKYKLSTTWPYSVLAATLMGLLSGCVTTPQLRTVSVEEAFSAIRTLENEVKESPQPHQEFVPLYFQPVNKSVPCKLPTTQDQLDRNNYRQYWDGDCKDGFAYGLGRDIAISDTHHLETILKYGDNASMNRSLIVQYDFVHQAIYYVLPADDRGHPKLLIQERIINEAGNFNIEHGIREFDKNVLTKVVEWQEFNPVNVFTSANKNIVYRFQYNSIATSNQTPVELLQTFESHSSQGPFGYSIARFPNGLVTHVKEEDGVSVELPTEYVSMLLNKYAEVQETARRGVEIRKQAKKMEKEYLYFACNGKHLISGLGKDISNKLCTWSEQFKEPYKVAQKKYVEWQERNLERMRAEARTQQEQQRLQVEHQRLQQQQEQQAWDALNRGLKSFDDSMDSIIQNTPKTTNTNCNKRWDGSVNCSSTTY